MLDNLSEQTTAEKSAAKTALDIKALRKQGVNRSSLHLCNCSHHLPSCAYSSSGAVAVAVVRRSCSRIDVGVINCNCNCISQRLLHAAAQMIGPSMHKVIQVVYTHARAAVHIAAVCRQPQSFHELSRTSCTAYAHWTTAPWLPLTVASTKHNHTCVMQNKDLTFMTVTQTLTGCSV